MVDERRAGERRGATAAAPRRPVAIVGAMHEEMRALLPLLDGISTERLGGRDIHRGTLRGRPVLLALSGIGKVAAATTATLLLTRFDLGELLFTGVAGGLAEGVSIGDIVVADRLLQHDLDASPLFPRFEVPLTGRSHFPVDPARVERLAAAARRVLRDADGSSGWQAERFGSDPPRVHTGLVVSGDRFVSTSAESAALRRLLPEALAVEMEGAAVAQVCAAFDRPFAVVRTISDRADDLAPGDFARFVDAVASRVTRAIVEAWIEGVA